MNDNNEEESVYALTKSQRGGVVLHYPKENGYAYSFQSNGKRVVESSDGIEEYRNVAFMCQNGRHRGCNARLLADKRVINGESHFHNFRMSRDHSEACTPSPFAYVHATASEHIVNEVLSGQDFRSVYNNAIVLGNNSMQSTTPAAVPSFIQATSLARKVERRLAAKYPPVPESNNVVFPVNWQHIGGDCSKERLLLMSECNTTHSIIILGRLDMFKVLCQHSTWYMDGTFKTCPTVFSQLFTIHFIVSNRSVSALYCLLSGKSQAIYTRLFTMIAELASVNNAAINITNVMVDFELAIRNAIRSVWANTTVNGCYFHFCQALYHRMTSLGLKVN